jgi:hypothetical protein
MILFTVTQKLTEVVGHVKTHIIAVLRNTSEFKIMNFVKWGLLQTPCITSPSCPANSSSSGYEISTVYEI